MDSSGSANLSDEAFVIASELNAVAPTPLRENEDVAACKAALQAHGGPAALAGGAGFSAGTCGCMGYKTPMDGK